MLAKLEKIQNEYALKIKKYLESLKAFEGLTIDVEFKIDYELHEYFIIHFGENSKLIIECEETPYLRWVNNIFNSYYDLYNTDNVIHRLASNKIIYDLILKLANQYYTETQKILCE